MAKAAEACAAVRFSSAPPPPPTSPRLGAEAAAAVGRRDTSNCRGTKHRVALEIEGRDRAELGVQGAAIVALVFCLLKPKGKKDKTKMATSTSTFGSRLFFFQLRPPPPSLRLFFLSLPLSFSVSTIFSLQHS